MLGRPVFKRIVTRTAAHLERPCVLAAATRPLSALPFSLSAPASHTKSFTTSSPATISAPDAAVVKRSSAEPTTPAFTYSPAPATSHTQAFFHKPTSTWTYLLTDPVTSVSALIDPVLDYDPASRTVSTPSADALLAYIQSQKLDVQWILETHAHADHLSAARYLSRLLPSKDEGMPKIGIGRCIGQVQHALAPRYSVPGADMDGAFDAYFKENEEIPLGELTIKVMHLPGHTPDHLGYVCGEHAFVGDTVFLPDVGTARADFPGGSATALYTSMRALLSLPPSTRIFVGHDYLPPTRTHPACSATVQAYLDHPSEHWHEDEDAWVKWRKNRDATLGEPRLLHESLQTNFRGGKLPRGGDGGVGFWKPAKITAKGIDI